MVGAGTCVQDQLRSNRVGILAPLPHEIDFDALAATQLIFEDLSRALQVVHDDIQVAVDVEVSHAHAPAAALRSEAPLGRQHEIAATAVTERAILLDQLM